MRTWMWMILMALVALLVRLPLWPEFLALHDSDFLIYPAASDWMSRSDGWRWFPFDQGYGGLWWSTFRAACVALSPLDRVMSHAVFSYAISSTCVAWAYFACARLVFKKELALGIGFLAAFGFPYWTAFGGLDLYQGFLIASVLFVAAKKWAPQALLDWNARWIFIAGVIAGFALTQFRANALFVCVWLVPWEALGRELKAFVHSTHRWDRLFLWVSILFFTLGVGLQFSGGELGTWFGHRVRLHAEPNIWVGAMIVLVAIAIKVDPRIRRKLFSQCAFFCGGVALGFVPELIHNHLHGATVSSVMLAHPGDRALLWTQVPHAVGDLLLGPKSIRVGPEWIYGFWTVLGGLSILALVWDARKNWFSRAVLISGILAVFAYTRLFVSAPGGSRYLFPLYPALVVGAGILGSYLAEWGRVGRLVALFGLICFGLASVSHHLAWAEASRRSGRVAEIHAVIKAFEDRGLDSVITDSYWQSLQYSFASDYRVLFCPTRHPQNPPEACVRAQSRSKVGVLLTENKSSPIDLLGRRMSLTAITSVGKLGLFEGAVQDP